MPIDGHAYLVSQGWSGTGSGLREGAIARPIAVSQKKTLSGLGKDRDEAFPFWDHLYSAAASAIKLKIDDSDEEHEDSEQDNRNINSAATVKRTRTGILSNRRPIDGAVSASTSGTTTPDCRLATPSPHFSLLATAKREAAKRGLYSMFFRGPLLRPDEEPVAEHAGTIQVSKSLSVEITDAPKERKKDGVNKKGNKRESEGSEAESDRRERKKRRKELKEAERQGKKKADVGPELEDKERKQMEKALKKVEKREKKALKSKSEEAGPSKSSSDGNHDEVDEEKRRLRAERKEKKAKAVAAEKRTKEEKSRKKKSKAASDTSTSESTPKAKETQDLQVDVAAGVTLAGGSFNARSVHESSDKRVKKRRKEKDGSAPVETKEKKRKRDESQ